MFYRQPGPAAEPHDGCAPDTKRALGSDITVAPFVNVSSVPMPYETVKYSIAEPESAAALNAACKGGAC